MFRSAAPGGGQLKLGQILAANRAVDRGAVRSRQPCPWGRVKAPDDLSWAIPIAERDPASRVVEKPCLASNFLFEFTAA